MTPASRPRGPLPARVYWTRRLLVVAVAFALVFGIARLLGSGGSGEPSAQPVGADASTSAPTAATTSASAQVTMVRNKAGKLVTPTPTPTPLAAPTGPCTGSDVVVRPSLSGPAYAGQPVVFTLTLTTLVSPACTWDVSARALVVKVTSGTDRIWSTQECAGAVPKQSVVVRKLQPVTVAVAWNGQRSDSDCTRTTAWAEPGFYHATAASFGAEPIDQQFELQAPPRPTITATPTPDSTPAAKTSPGKSPAKSPVKATASQTPAAQTPAAKKSP